MLQPGSFYHIYNHANGHENLFIEDRNFYFFLQKMRVYLSPCFKIYAYCLMPNHFHLLVCIKTETEIRELFNDSAAFQKLNQTQQVDHLYKKISKGVANLCSCYTQSFNKVYHRKGSLFMPNFKSNLINNEVSFRNVVHYIHANPVHHNFVTDLRLWKFSSFYAILSTKQTTVEREYVLELFGGRKEFDKYHQQRIPSQNTWHDL